MHYGTRGDFSQIRSVVRPAQQVTYSTTVYSLSDVQASTIGALLNSPSPSATIDPLNKRTVT